MPKSIGRGLVGAGAILLAILLTGCSDTPSPTPSAEAVPSPTVTAQPGVTPEPTPASTMAPANTPTPEPTPTPTPAPTHTPTPEPTPTPTMAPTNTPTPEPTPATATLSLGVYLTLCASNLELADDLTFGDFSSELAAEADRFEALTPPAQLSEWHLLNIEAYRTAQAVADTQPKDDVVDFDSSLLIAAESAFVEKSREAAARVPKDVLQQMIEAHCINPDFVPDDDEEVPDDHGNDIDDATSIRVGTEVRGALDYDGDIDFFRFQAEQGQSYQIDVALGTLHDSTVDLYDGDGSLLGSNDDYGDTLASRLYWNAPSSGERYVAVEGYGIGTYTLTVSLSDVIDDHGNSEGEATAIRVGTEVRGALDYDGDIDFFRFQAEAGRGYQIDVALGTLDDSIVELYDGDGAFVDTNDDYGDTLASRLYWNAPSSGERYVAVAGYGIGTYTLMVSLVDDHGNDFESATRITIRETVAIELENDDDIDVLVFRARPSTVYVLSLNWEYYSFRESSTERPLLAVYSSNGQEHTRLMGYDFSRISVPSIDLQWQAVTGGNYYIVIGDGNTEGAGAFYVTREGATEPTATPSTVPTQAPEPTPAAMTLSLDEYLTLCAPPESDLADDATYGDLSSELATEADRVEALTPPAQLSEWHLLNIENYRTIQAVFDTYPKDDVIDFANLLLIAAAADELEGKLGEVAVRLPEDVLQRMIEAGCIDPGVAPYDYVNEFESATRIAIGEAVAIEFESPDDEGMFVFLGEPGAEYVFTLDWESWIRLSDPSRPIMVLFDAGGQELARLEDDDSSQNMMMWQAVTGGDYYIAVGDGATFGSLALTVTVGGAAEPLDRDDHANSEVSATAIRVGADVRGAVGYDGDIDFFRFQAEQGQSYQIDVALGTLDDSIVELYDGDGAFLDTNDDYGDTLASRLYWNAPSSGERYVAVEGYGIGTYTLTVSLIIDDHGNSEGDATAIRVGTEVRGAVDYDDDIDFFRFQAERGQSYQIDVALGTLDDSIVDLYDVDGSFLDSNDDYGDTLASRLYWEAPSSGERYVAVEGYGTGTYTLTVSLVDDHGDTAEDGVGVASDRAALVALYNATEGGSWKTRTNWLSGRPLDEWHGVTTDSDGRVTALNLSSNSLYGALPAALGDLTNLESLRLSDNPLTGPIPAALGDLTNLVELILSANELTGPIPAALGDLTNLESLRLSGNELTGPIPAALGDLTNLESLSLGWNELTGPIPAWLGDLSNLESLVLSNNQLTGPIPAALGDLSNLESLWLGWNQLTGPIPAALGNLTNLQSLRLWGNDLTGPIPAALGDLTNLSELDLRSNELTGPIPAALGDLSNLQSLWIGWNELTGPIPAALGDLSNLQSLWIGWNELTGPIPAALGDLANLVELDLSGNQLTGPIPAALGDLSNLQSLWIGSNQLTGPIPAALGDLANLEYLYLSVNELTGPIPAKLSNLSNLSELYLSGNDLTGCVPVGLRDVAEENDLGELDLPDCGLEGRPAAGSFVSVNAGRGYTCGVRSDGSVACWGSNGDGKAAPPAGSFLSVSAEDFHTCGVRSDGSVACWGWDEYGQATPPAGSFDSVSVGYDHTCGVRSNGSVACWGDGFAGEATPPAGSFVSVNAGDHHTCGVRSDGSVACWGDRFAGEATPPAGSFDSVSAGGGHTCGVRSDGSVACWGEDEDGQATPPAGSFDSVSAGFDHTCGVRSDGSVACWGDDFNGEATPPAGSFLSVSAGSRHTCGVRSNGSVACWGDNEYGEDTPPASSFVSVSAGGNRTCGVRSDGSVACWGWNGNGEATPLGGSFVSVSAGRAHTCGVRSNGSVACWGWNGDGRAGPPAGSFVSVSAGRAHTCGVRSDGSVACWGGNWNGEATPPAGSFDSVSAGGGHTCGVRSNGSVACWGYNGDGEATPPAGSFDSVSAGWDHTCGVRSDGSVACWGYNGDGEATPPAGSFDSVSAGTGHTCGVMSNGSVACWGDNQKGQATPPAGSFVSVSAGWLHTCGVRSDGSVACWGRQARGLTASDFSR